MTSFSSYTVLLGYRRGIFLMAESKTSKEMVWIKPKERGIIPIGKLHISRSLKKYIKSNKFHTTINTAFEEVVARCANRPTSWINQELFNIYQDLYKQGHAFSIEVWLNKKLIGGLFGIKIGSCFCGESMFSAEKNGSKLALIATMARLQYNEFKLFDTQFPTTHLNSMGGCTITQIAYERLLFESIDDIEHTLTKFPSNYSWSEIIQLNNHRL
tara:strand:- start:46 stop:687 length:642 start_codon:yes stop_codon:yes gene_type:complete